MCSHKMNNGEALEGRRAEVADVGAAGGDARREDEAGAAPSDVQRAASGLRRALRVRPRRVEADHKMVPVEGIDYAAVGVRGGRDHFSHFGRPAMSRLPT